MQGNPLLQREPLGVPHRGIALTHPSNPVVFMDIVCPKAVAGTGQSEHPYRFLFELFADLAPTLAANAHGLCIGSTTRLVEQRPQPAGYKDTVLHDTFVGQHVVGGDVMDSGGSGFFSALGERQGPLQVPPSELQALVGNAPSRCERHQGLYMQYWNYAPAAAAVAAKVASTFRIDTVERGAEEKMPPDGVLVGRMVHRDAEARAEAARQLLELSKAIFHAKRNSMPQLLPKIVLCGEM
ncbi:hypothetical protein DQ04_05201020 [Trypanosoma grayi]|uniref:hypothetical protein n=1 Tax=Trypanosoma grayi TaxID=71804 RepID=UPI0004F41D6F|nr:hypothetical protein DQ04_05201020 [Trypanosoma grayi]KEG09450.1 hypothetical protein DQ04_05201020 [Trypanosoma grayi]